MSHSLSRLSADHLNFDRLQPNLRASPLFHCDSEPPSYFEAVGLSPHINYGASGVSNEIYLNIDHQAQVPTYNQQQNPQRIIGNSNSEILFSSNKDYQPNPSYQPTPQRQQFIRTRDLTESNHPYYNYTYESGSGSLKPSETYIFWSVFTTIYCVFIGMVALVFSLKVKHYNKVGLFQKANSASKIARNFNIAGLLFGVVYLAIGLLVCFLPR